MNTKLLLCLSLALSSCLPPLFSAGENSPRQEEFNTHPYHDRTVGKISLKVEDLPRGASFDRQSVLSKLRTHEGDLFSQYIFDQDLKQLAEDFDRVEPDIHVSGNFVDITLKVWVRPIIKLIEWEGNSYIKTKTLQKELGIKEGTIFNRATFNKAFNKLKEYYIKRGYFESELSYRLVRHVESGEVDVIIHISEGRSGKVDDIVFQGFSSQEESEILDQFYTKKYSALTSWITGQGKFNEEALEQDRLTVFNRLQDWGYADASVQIDIIESPKEGKVIIQIKADKGPLYHFGKISFNGNILFSDEEIEKAFLARPDGVYSPEALRKTSEAIKDLYGRKGYIDSSVTYETQLVQNAPFYNIHFQIQEGHEYRIGMIRILGNVSTQSRVILRESLLVPGATFDSLKLKVTQARLENMGYFKTVNVYAVRTQDDLSLGDNYRDIYIEVEEKQTGDVSFFGGFSSAEQGFGGLTLTERNFNYKGISKVLGHGLSSLRGGGEFLLMKATLGQKEQSYLISWLSPYFLDSPWRIGFDFLASVNNRLQSKDYNLNTYNFSTSFVYPLSPYLAYGVNYRIRSYKNIIKDVVDVTGKREGDEIFMVRHESNGILSGLGSSLTYDSTDSAIRPHRGLRSVLDGEFVGLGGSATFARVGFQNAYYTPLWSRGYMRYRGDLRFIFPIGTTDFEKVPISERFFLGGTASVRGYKDFILGSRYDKLVQVGDTMVEEKGLGDPTGGISSSFLSVEYIQDIFPFLQGFAFMDAGYVSSNRLEFGTYRMSYGVGANLSIMGQLPMTLGVAFPVNPAEGQATDGRFFFSFGAQF